MIGLQWYLLGMLTVMAWNGFQRLRQQFHIDWKGTLGLLASAGSMWMCIAWSVSSWVEGENQSAAMGVAMFGLISLILGTLTWRWFIAPNPKQD